jgi:hypothetical protein
LGLKELSFVRLAARFIALVRRKTAKKEGP